MEQENIITISGAESLAALNRSEIDMQVATAKAYPRNIHKVLDEIITYATYDQETAVDCFYSLPRGGKPIEGLSVRMAEIFAGAWGNLRAQARIIANDGKFITAQGVCYDVEKNVAISVEVKRRITDKYGKTFNDDMQTVTGNAACAIAFRNAVFKVIPKAVTKTAVEKIKEVAIGKAKDMTTIRTNMIAWYNQVGVTQADLLEHIGVQNVEDINNEMVFELRALCNAIREGDTTVEEAILQPLKAKRKAKVAEAEATTNKAKVAKAMAKQDTTTKTEDNNNDTQETKN